MPPCRHLGFSVAFEPPWRKMTPLAAVGGPGTLPVNSSMAMNSSAIPPYHRRGAQRRQWGHRSLIHFQSDELVLPWVQDGFIPDFLLIFDLLVPLESLGLLGLLLQFVDYGFNSRSSYGSDLTSIELIYNSRLDVELYLANTGLALGDCCSDCLGNRL